VHASVVQSVLLHNKSAHECSTKFVITQ